MMNYDVIIVGSGPSGIFTSLEEKTLNPEKNILLIDAGRRIDKRSCPKEKTNVCVSCKPYCHITTGFSGAGAFSDGKLSLNYEVGGDLPELMGPSLVQEFIDYTDKIYLDFGADTIVEGVGNNEAVKEIRRKAIKGNLKLVDCPIRHLGTEMAQQIYLKIQNHLLELGVEIKFDTVAKNLIVEDNAIKGVLIADSRTKKIE